MRNAVAIILLSIPSIALADFGIFGSGGYEWRQKKFLGDDAGPPNNNSYFAGLGFRFGIDLILAVREISVGDGETDVGGALVFGKQFNIPIGAGFSLALGPRFALMCDYQKNKNAMQVPDEAEQLAHQYIGENADALLSDYMVSPYFSGGMDLAIAYHLKPLYISLGGFGALGFGFDILKKDTNVSAPYYFGYGGGLEGRIGLLF